MGNRQKFATQVDPILLEQTKAIAQAEGRQLQAVIEEALTDLVTKKSKNRSRPHVMEHYEASLEQHDCLYERLTKA